MVVGSALLVTGDDRGRPHLDRCIGLAHPTASNTGLPRRSESSPKA
jgi:hypothetical protein